jgi:hypothetical protein
MNGVISQWGKRSGALTLAFDGTFIKIMNTALGLLVFLRMSCETSSGDRFGTHPKIPFKSGNR